MKAKPDQTVQNQTAELGIQLKINAVIGQRGYWLELNRYAASDEEAESIFEEVKDVLKPHSVGGLQKGEEGFGMRFDFSEADFKTMFNKKKVKAVELKVHHLNRNMGAIIPLPHIAPKDSADLAAFVGKIRRVLNARSSSKPEIGSYCYTCNLYMDYLPGSFRN